MQNENTPIEENDTPSAGVPDGTVLKGNDGIEIVVEDKDDDGNVIGWHKEVQNG